MGACIIDAYYRLRQYVILFVDSVLTYSHAALYALTIFLLIMRYMCFGSHPQMAGSRVRSLVLYFLKIY